MGDTFKAYVNKAAFATTANEMMITLYVDRPSLNAENSIEIIREEIGTVIFTHEYAETFKDAMEKNLKSYKDNKAKLIESPEFSVQEKSEEYK